MTKRDLIRHRPLETSIMRVKISKEKKRKKIKIIDLIAKGSEYAHLNVPDKITFIKEEKEENKNN